MSSRLSLRLEGVAILVESPLRGFDLANPGPECDESLLVGLESVHHVGLLDSGLARAELAPPVRAAILALCEHCTDR